MSEVEEQEDEYRRPDRQGFVSRNLCLWLAVTLCGAGIVGIVDGSFVSTLDITPQTLRHGWDEARAKVDAPVIAARMPAFAIRDVEGNIISGAGKTSELWKFAKLVNDGHHIPTWRQESGDCVSMGWSNAIAYLSAYQIAKDQRNEVLKIPFTPYGYGTSRVFVGKRQLGRGAGSIGAWAAEASTGYGVYTVDQAKADGFTYSGRLADKWGWEGPPPKTVETGKKHRVNHISQVRSWEDVRDALAYGFPVTVASNVGFEGGYYDKDGKRFLRPRGRWAHQMCLIGMEDRIDHEKGAYCINSWGTDAHPKPIGGEPPGGFWIDWQTVQRMVSQGDSWAYADFDGFKVDRKDDSADWNIFRDDQLIEAVNDDLPAKIVALEEAEKPEPQTTVETVREVRKWYASYIGWFLEVAGGVLAGVWMRQRRRAESPDCSCSC